MKRVKALAAGMLTALTTMPAVAATPAADCPVAKSPYSIDSLLIDVLLEPRAKAALEQALAPGVKIPSFFTSTKTPTMAAIISPRGLATQLGGALDLSRLDKTLAAIPLTPQAVRARCARYNGTPVVLAPTKRPALLVFTRVNGFNHGQSIVAATAAIQAMGERRGWSVVVTDKPGAINPATLTRFDAVVWNNVSGDVLTLGQRAALKRWIERGGGFAGIHGAGGDGVNIWAWYAETLVGARFLGHPMKPQFQEARVIVDNARSGIGRGIGEGWSMSEEWYSFRSNPRATGAQIVARLDEASYRPGDGPVDLRMGSDHPIAWTRCIGNGRSFYTAIGHRPESYQHAQNMQLLAQGLEWAMGKGRTRCAAGREVTARRPDRATG